VGRPYMPFPYGNITVLFQFRIGHKGVVGGLVEDRTGLKAVRSPTCRFVRHCQALIFPRIILMHLLCEEFVSKCIRRRPGLQ
jgi:hypothetical protein